MKTVLIDCEYELPQYAGAFLLIDDGQAAFVENNTNHAVPLLLKALAENKLKPEDVRYVIITHVHLDHAGGTAELLKACPNAVCLAHPRAARHVINPSKLVASARSVYGEEQFAKLYGEINPVAEERVRSLEDESTVEFGSGEFAFLHTRGHAKHHFCIHNRIDNSLFTGDSFGLAFPALQDEDLFIFPTTSPTDYEGAEALKTLDRITGLKPDTIHLTHFGSMLDDNSKINEAADKLRIAYGDMEGIFNECLSLGDVSLEKRSERALLRMQNWFERAEAKRNTPYTDKQKEYLQMDIQLNADGIAWAAHRKLQTKK